MLKGRDSELRRHFHSGTLTQFYLILAHIYASVHCDGIIASDDSDIASLGSTTRKTLRMASKVTVRTTRAERLCREGNAT